MINIRYHIVSITAVFLALGIGVALGSTFLDRATVDVLDRNIRNAENRIRETGDENDRLRAAVDRSAERDTGLILSGSGDLFEGHLTDLPIVVVAAPGVEDADTSALAYALERSGATLRATVSLRDRMLLDGEVDEGLATALGLPEASSVEVRREVYAQLSEALRAAGARIEPAGEVEAPEGEGDAPDDQQVGDPDDDTGIEPTEPASFGEPSIIEALRSRDYLRVAPGPDFDDEAPLLDAAGHRYVFIGSPTITEAQGRALIALLPVDLTLEPLPAVVVSASPADDEDDEIEPPPTVVELIRSDEGLAASYSTVDNVDTFAGIAATVLVLDDFDTAAPAHFGQAEGAVAILPPAP